MCNSIWMVKYIANISYIIPSSHQSHLWVNWEFLIKNIQLIFYSIDANRAEMSPIDYWFRRTILGIVFLANQ